MTSPAPPLALPPAPPSEHRAGFPWFASVAPIIGALALWTMTGSPFALAFAALGPIVALASLADGRRHAGRARARWRSERRAALDELRREVAARHAAERDLAWRATPSTRRLLESPPGAGWRRTGPVAVVLGSGSRHSDLQLGGAAHDDADRAVVDAAARLTRAPILADPAGGIGFVGPAPLARAAARAALVQLAQRSTPGAVGIRVPGEAGWSWARSLPHRGGRDEIVVCEAGAPDRPEPGRRSPVDRSPGGRPTTWCLAIAADREALTPGLRTVVRVESPAFAVLEQAEGAPDGRALVPELLSAADAANWATAASAAAVKAGLAEAARPVPSRVPFDELAQPRLAEPERASLAVAVGVGRAGPVRIDLVRDGPHALVAGTSGSGKSEFLLAWLAALAAVHPPRLVNFLLVDFKGGAAFEPVRELPHVAGIVTDLDEAEAVRAIESLRAELRHREETLRAAGARAISELGVEPVLPRLVIVVDEFQAMVERFPELAPLIGDIASRGRSLGVHLVLAAQRPNGVIRESVTANCGVRVSLRVLHRADSLAVVGTEAAAELDPSAPGRAVLAREGEVVEFQSALVAPTEFERGRRATAGPAARRPWLDPLPSRLTRPELSGAGIEAPAEGEFAFGLADEPDRQRRSLALWRPLQDGPFVVVGSAGSGRSTALGALADAFAERHGPGAVVALAGPPGTEWDLAHDELGRLRCGRARPRLVVIDDLDTRYRAWPEEHRFAMLDTLAALGREGRATGLHLAASAASVLALPSVIREAVGAAVLLRHPGRTELVQAGGAGELWRADEPPGAGQWRGRRIQVTFASPVAAPREREVPRLELAPERPTAVVSRAPAADAERLAGCTGRRPIVLRAGSDAAARAMASLADPAEAPVVVADADTWTGQWMLLAAIRERGDVVVHAGATEYRAVTREREPPPMLDPGREQCWLWVEGAPVTRCSWP